MVGELLAYVQELYLYLWKNIALKAKRVIANDMIFELSDHLYNRVVFLLIAI